LEVGSLGLELAWAWLDGVWFVIKLVLLFFPLVIELLV
jgi:hypothetical protein